MTKRKNRDDKTRRPPQEVSKVRSSVPPKPLIDRLRAEYNDEEGQRRNSARRRDNEGVSASPHPGSFQHREGRGQRLTIVAHRPSPRPFPRADNVALFPIHPPADNSRRGVYCAMIFS